MLEEMVLKPVLLCFKRLFAVKTRIRFFIVHMFCLYVSFDIAGMVTLIGAPLTYEFYYSPPS